ncbi:MAG: CapA family protein [Candidatus Latescibacteria bacterium]|nr:CapA family protein [Candidatus Latescibacterota bacterium]
MRDLILKFAATIVLLLSFPEAGAAQLGGEGDTFNMALTGDSIITRKLSVYSEPEFISMIELIRSADVAFTNLEMLFHDYEPYPMHASGGTWMRGDPQLAKELAWAGFDMVSMANNHTGDYGVLGMRLTMQYVEEAGLVHAGVGESFPEAREAKFLETAQARVALISVASTFTDHSVAGRTRGDMPARPGLSPLRYRSTRVVLPEHLDRLRDVLRDMGQRVSEQGQRLSVFGTRLVAGEEPGTYTETNQQDLEEIAAVVSSAGRMADYTIVAFHSHEGGRGRNTPADFLVEFAHAMIDAGADVLVGHGPHVLKGIELYKGKPIFYSLGDFMFQNETLLRLPSENYERYGLGPDAHVADFNDRRYNNDRSGFPARRQIWESVIAVPAWREGKLVELNLYPITLGFGKPRQVRGRPLLADEELGRKIIEDLILCSEPLGTRIDLKDGIGVVQIPDQYD